MRHIAMRHVAALLTADAYEMLAQHNPALAQALLADIEEGATLDDVRDFIDAAPQLSQSEAALVLRAAAHLIDQRAQPEAQT